MTNQEKLDEKAKQEVRELALTERIELLEAEVRVLVALCRNLSQRMIAGVKT